MAMRIAGWFGLVSVIIISLVGFGWYLTFLTLIVSFLIGIITILYYSYDNKNMLPVEVDHFSDPLQQTNYAIEIPKVMELFDKDTRLLRFDSRITGSDIVDSCINEIIAIIINDYVTPWYEILTDDVELTTHAINRLVVATGANLANRIKCVDWTYILSTRFPEEFTTHLKLFKQSKVRLKHIQLNSSKDLSNGLRSSPKKEEKRTHRRNKSDTDLSWASEGHTFGKSKFYDSAENVNGKTLIDLFFDLESTMGNKEMCRDTFCIDNEKEYALLCEVSEAVLYLVAPQEVWKCHALKLFLIELLSSIVLRSTVNLLSDPDNINRAIINSCVRDSTLSSELFLLVIRSCSDAEELDATLELVQKDIQKLHSKDSAGEWELQDRQKLSSLRYLTRIIQARRATLGPQEGASNANNTEKVSEEVSRSLKFLRDTTAWRSNAQYLLEIEVNDDDEPYTSKSVLENLRSSALELCDLYLAPNKPTVMGIPENCYSEMVRKITMEGEDFTNNPSACFDDVQRCVCVALEDDPSWQSDLMMDNEENTDRNFSDFKKDDKQDNKKYSGDALSITGSRHNRSRSDIVGNFAQKMVNEGAGPSSLITANSSNISHSHTEISKNARNMMSPLTASIIETALVQDKGRTFGIYAISVCRLSDDAEWHIYRRYSDFYDLHASIKDKDIYYIDRRSTTQTVITNTNRNMQ